MTQKVVWIFMILLFPLYDAGQKTVVAKKQAPKETTNPKPAYVKTTALAGDGVNILLRRYGLFDYPCNRDEFYKINKLKKNSGLIVGHEYQLPIFIYKYNGKSIRSTIGIDDWDRAVRIQEFNLEMLSQKFRTQAFTDNKDLWVPFHELNCPDANIPKTELPDPELGVKGKPRHYPIFGPKYAYTPQESKKLVGKVFYVSSGHGGPDPGAQGKSGNHTLCEDEYAYDVSLRLVRNLIAHGATAYMITRDENDGIRDGKYLKCDADERTWPAKKMPVNQKERLFLRSDAINELYEKHRKQGVVEQKLIAIHVDSRSRGMQTDVFFYYHPDSDDGKKFAGKIHRTFIKKYKKYRRTGEYHGTVTSRDLHMLRECKPVGVYIELGNIRNPFDQQRIMIEANRRALAAWLYEGVSN